MTHYSHLRSSCSRTASAWRVPSVRFPVPIFVNGACPERVGALSVFSVYIPHPSFAFPLTI